MRRLALKAWKEKRPLRQVMEEDEEATRLITPAEMDEWLNPHNYIGTSVEQVDRAVAELRKNL
jgi:adenylosuccinate lyase